ncbi:hypothetical protein CTI12_AA352770 [Artemisia annua]|uniref:Uncharacterized protein n=1 Tax=Artemisia annua TaxID=35608 RepID=A0A2U1MQL4_ARTAN|nr:hypothetical protein CTI12_AA352770 [Artemisia annua]
MALEVIGYQRGSLQLLDQVVLISSNSEEKVEINHIVILKKDAISSEIVITNLRPSSLKRMGSTISHLAISTRSNLRHWARDL